MILKALLSFLKKAQKEQVSFLMGPSGQVQYITDTEYDQNWAEMET